MRGCASVNERRAGRAQVAARGRVGAAVAVAAALGVAGLAAPAAAADVTWFVDAGAGLDAEGCGEAPGPAACATIGAALERVTAGDVVEIAAGRYVETLRIETPVTLHGAATDLVTLAGAAEREPVVTVDADGTVALSDMTIHPEQPSGTYAPSVVHVGENRAAELTRVAIRAGEDEGFAGTGVLALSGSTVAIEGSSISGLLNGVAVGSSGSAGVEISESILTSNREGIRVLAGTVTVTGGELSENTTAGVRTVGTEAVVDLTGTTIRDNGPRESGSTHGGLVLQNGGTIIGDGLVLSGHSYGVNARGGSVTLRNSTVTDNGWIEEG